MVLAPNLFGKMQKLAVRVIASLSRGHGTDSKEHRDASSLNCRIWLGRRIQSKQCRVYDEALTFCSRSDSSHFTHVDFNEK